MSEQLTVDAEPGDVWAFSIEGEELIVGFAVVADVWGHIEFRTVLGNVLKLPTSVYTDARKIWPPEEPEWGTALRSSNGDVWDEFWHASRGDAEKEIAEDSEDDHAPDEIVLVRRTRAIPAGQIEVVEGDAK